MSFKQRWKAHLTCLSGPVSRDFFLSYSLKMMICQTLFIHNMLFNVQGYPCETTQPEVFFFFFFFLNTVTLFWSKNNNHSWHSHILRKTTKVMLSGLFGSAPVLEAFLSFFSTFPQQTHPTPPRYPCRESSGDVWFLNGCWNNIHEIGDDRCCLTNHCPPPITSVLQPLTWRCLADPEREIHWNRWCCGPYPISESAKGRSL